MFRIELRETNTYWRNDLRIALSSLAPMAVLQTPFNPFLRYTSLAIRLEAFKLLLRYLGTTPFRFATVYYTARQRAFRVASVRVALTNYPPRLAVVK